MKSKFRKWFRCFLFEDFTGDLLSVLKQVSRDSLEWFKCHLSQVPSHHFITATTIFFLTAALFFSLTSFSFLNFSFSFQVLLCWQNFHFFVIILVFFSNVPSFLFFVLAYKEKLDYLLLFCYQCKLLQAREPLQGKRTELYFPGK